MKLLFIIPTLGAGGAERVATTLLNQWDSEKNLDIEVVILNESVDFYSLNSDIRTFRLGYLGGKNIFLKMLLLIKTAILLRRTIRKSNPDVILSFMRETNIFTLLSSLFLGRNIVISERDSPDVKVSFFMKSLRKILYPFAKYIIAQTSDYKDFILKEVNNKNVIVIPNPVREMILSDIPKENIILSVGRLIPSKGHSLLLTAFAKLPRNLDWRLVIVGDGRLKSELAKKAESLNIYDKVDFVGPTKEIEYFLNKSSIFVSSSLSEGFPNALLEAMSAGVPSISINCKCGPNDIIVDGQNGFLVEVGNVDTLANKMQHLIEQPLVREKFSTNSKIVAKKYNVEMISERYLNVILSAK